MRTYGRIFAVNPDGSRVKPQPPGYPYWVKVTTDANGFNDLVYLVTLCQCFLLNLNESPFYSQYGLPAKDSVVQQVWPDYNVARTQQQFSGYFANLIVAREPGATAPTYKVNVTTNYGAKISQTVEIPQ